MAAPKNPVSGKTVKKTTYNLLNPLAKPKVTTTTERTTRKPAAKPTPKATKKATPSPSAKPKLGPLPKNPTLNDYLVRGLKPPIKKGTKLPSDADVKIKGYNA
jgi:hypothetical protein